MWINVKIERDPFVCILSLAFSLAYLQIFLYNVVSILDDKAISIRY